MSSDVDDIISELSKGPEAPPYSLQISEISEDHVVQLAGIIQKTRRWIGEVLFCELDDEAISRILVAMTSNSDYCCSKVTKILQRGSTDETRPSLPNFLLNFPELHQLDLLVKNDQDLAPLPSCFKGLSKLKHLHMIVLNTTSTAISTHLNAAFQHLSLLSSLRLDAHTIDGKSLIECLAHLAQLKYLDMSALFDSPTCAALSASLAEMTGLEEFMLRADGTSFDEEAFSRGLRCLTGLSSLTLFSDRARGIRSIDSIPANLKSLSLWGWIDSEGMTALGASLQRLTGLVELELSRNGDIEDCAMESLCAGILASKSSLTSLGLTESHMGSEAVKSLGNCLQQLTVLRELVVNECGVSASGLQSICGSLSDSLVKLDFGCNYFSDEDALAVLWPKARAMPNLRELHLIDAYADLDRREWLLKEGLPNRSLSHLTVLEVAEDQTFDLDEARSHPLHFAAYIGDVELIRKLLQESADVGLAFKDGGTALHMAARRGENKVIEVLVKEAGARLDAKNKDGKTPLDVAEDVIRHYPDEEEGEVIADLATTRALLLDLMETGADERPGEMIKGAAKRFRPFP